MRGISCTRTMPSASSSSSSGACKYLEVASEFSRGRLSPLHKLHCQQRPHHGWQTSLLPNRTGQYPRYNIDPVHSHAKLLGYNLCKTGEMSLSLRADACNHRDTATTDHLHLCPFIRADACSFHISDDANTNVFAFTAQLWLGLWMNW